MLNIEDKRQVIRYRIERSRQTLVEVDDNYKLGHYILAGNRMYYAVFYMALALLLDKGILTKSHAGVGIALSRDFINKGLLDKKFARVYSVIQDLRQSGDYDDLFNTTKEDIDILLPQAKELIEALRKLITLQE